MPAQKIYITIGKERMDEAEASLDHIDDKVIHAALFDFPKERLLTYLGPCNEDRLYASVEGREYKVTKLTAEGLMTLESTATE